MHSQPRAYLARLYHAGRPVDLDDGAEVLVVVDLTPGPAAEHVRQELDAIGAQLTEQAVIRPGEVDLCHLALTDVATGQPVWRWPLGRGRQ